MAISRHNAATGSSSTSTTVNAAILVGAGEIVVVQVNQEISSGAVLTVTGVADSNGNTYAKRFSASAVGAAEPDVGASEGFEVWWAYSPSSSAFLSVTATLSGTVDDAVIVVAGYQGFTGTSYHTNPWDADASLPKTAQAATTSLATASGISTTSTAGMLLAGHGSVSTALQPNAPTGFSAAGQIVNNGATNSQQGSLFDEVYSSVQSSITVATTTNNTVGWIFYVDALTDQAGGATPIVVGQTPPRVFLPKQGPDKGMRSPKAFPASPVSLTLPAAQGTYTLTGQVQTLGVGMPAAQGTYSLTGFAATLSVVPNPVGLTPPRLFRPDSGPHRNMRTAKAFATTGPAAYSLAAAQGNYTLTGFSAILNRGIQMSAAQGSYTLTGRAQTLNRGIVISAAQGSYTLNGQPVTPGVGMPAAQGSYALTGQSVTPAVGMPAAQGTYSLSGKPQAFAVALSILPQQGVYSLTGNGAVLTLTPAGGGGTVVYSNPFFATPGQLMNLQ